MLLFSQVECTMQLFWGKKRFIGYAFKLFILLFFFLCGKTGMTYVFPHRYGQEVELEAGSEFMKGLAWRDFTLMFSWENTLHTLTFWSERHCFRVLQLVFSSHGQPSVTSWEVPGSDWFPLPCDSHTFEQKGDTFTVKRKFPRMWHGHRMQSLFFTEKQCY